MRIAAVADIHFSRTSEGAFAELFSHASREADVLVLCGDLTDYGLCEEAEGLAAELGRHTSVPVLGVLGNHDFESGLADEVKQILTSAGMVILDGDSAEIDGVGFAGAKGFAGGFGRGTLSPWGEQVIKDFVQEAVDEAMKLESALARLGTERRVAVLHYAPIVETVAGEPPEIACFLGCSRLEEPLLKHPPAFVLHGHAHHGAPEGRTRRGTPVYNVSLPVLRGHDGSGPAYRLLEI